MVRLHEILCFMPQALFSLPFVECSSLPHPVEQTSKDAAAQAIHDAVPLPESRNGRPRLHQTLDLVKRLVKHQVDMEEVPEHDLEHLLNEIDTIRQQVSDMLGSGSGSRTQSSEQPTSQYGSRLGATSQNEPRESSQSSSPTSPSSPSQEQPSNAGHKSDDSLPGGIFKETSEGSFDESERVGLGVSSSEVHLTAAAAAAAAAPVPSPAPAGQAATPSVHAGGSSQTPQRPQIQTSPEESPAFDEPACVADDQVSGDTTMSRSTDCTAENSNAKDQPEVATSLGSARQSSSPAAGGLDMTPAEDAQSSPLPATPPTAVAPPSANEVVTSMPENLAAAAAQTAQKLRTVTVTSTRTRRFTVQVTATRTRAVQSPVGPPTEARVAVAANLTSSTSNEPASPAEKGVVGAMTPSDGHQHDVTTPPATPELSLQQLTTAGNTPSESDVASSPVPITNDKPQDKAAVIMSTTPAATAAAAAAPVASPTTLQQLVSVTKGNGTWNTFQMSGFRTVSKPRKTVEGDNAT